MSQNISFETEMLSETHFLIRLGGFFRHYDAEFFKRNVDVLIAQGRTILTFDLAGLGEITKAGIGCLLYAQQEAKKNGGRIVLCAPNNKVRYRIEKLGFVPFFEIEDRDA